jgi:predicted O-linked N-acetylglucosamine transferase (SPINDLY family)
MSDKSVADLIIDDKIDILVDLALHMAAHRLMVMAQKPAPVQVTFGGYPGTTGLTAIDYRLTDPYLDPPGMVEGGGDADYSEQSIRLPDSFWCFDPKAMDVEQYEIAPLPAIANGFVTFGCLNNFCKVNDGVLELWARVLKEVPSSHLLLLTRPAAPARDR